MPLRAIGTEFDEKMVHSTLWGLYKKRPALALHRDKSNVNLVDVIKMITASDCCCC